MNRTLVASHSDISPRFPLFNSVQFWSEGKYFFSFHATFSFQLASLHIVPIFWLSIKFVFFILNHQAHSLAKRSRGFRHPQSSVESPCQCFPPCTKAVISVQFSADQTHPPPHNDSNGWDALNTLLVDRDLGAGFFFWFGKILREHFHENSRTSVPRNR